MSYHTEVVPLDEYVKGVLPNEWLPSWDQEALRAGAVAVKNYGVATYLSQGYVWDCNYNQVYDPSKRTEQTDRAVEDTWDYWLIDSDFHLVKTYYDDYPGACAVREHECMSQYETQHLARQGYLLRLIILKNYSDAQIVLYNENYGQTQDNETR